MTHEREGRSDAGRPSAHPRIGAAWAPLNAALAAWRAGHRDAALVMRTDVAEDEVVPVALFFRAETEMGEVERAALDRARGRVLDLGAGPGAHASALVRRGLAVTAAEISPEARACLAEAGVTDVREGGLETLGADERFDTVLVLMNGLGLPGALAALPDFLTSIARHLAPGGQLLADSTDPRPWQDPDDGRYAGEVHMQLEFEGAAGPPFPFLFIDPDRLGAAAVGVGLELEVVAQEEDGRYLARLQRPDR